MQESDFISVQEIARDECGWQEHNGEQFHWLMHRHRDQYRGVAIGIAQDLLDCVIEKVATDRGMWALVRVKGYGRLVMGSLHCHTGVTQRVFADSVQRFFKAFKNKWRAYPILLGVDVNEKPTWSQVEGDEFTVINANVNMEAFLEEAMHLGLKTIAPMDSQLVTPSHYPRDSTRGGRQIDMLLVKAVQTTRVTLRPELRHCVGTDHAELHVDLLRSANRFQPWGADTRSRRLSALIPEQQMLIDDGDLRELAKRCTCPRTSLVFKDNDETKNLIAAARGTNDPKLWKQVHRERRRARKEWLRERNEAIVQGDWRAFRSYKRDRGRAKGWWGRMLVDKSAEQLTKDVSDHLQSKMRDPGRTDWGEVVENFVRMVPLQDSWDDFTKAEIFETLSHMRPHAAVGSDLVCVDLLKAVTLHAELGDQLVALVNQIVRENQQPADWNTSILALLAKCKQPSGPADLRPICIGSNFCKLTNRLVMGRVFPILRRGSRVSACGKGRQVADLVGAMTRVRDMSHEWREPLLIAKLDVAGAFDRLSRSTVAELILQRTRDRGVGREVRYLLQQLEVNQLVGQVPGGGEINIEANIGIRQGAPDSAEMFGLVMGMLLDDMVLGKSWRQIGAAIQDLDIDLFYFQDDIFLFEVSAARLARKIAIIGSTLSQAGLKLAMQKTKVIATPDYHGVMKMEIESEQVKILKGESIRVLGVSFDFASPPTQQAEELLGRARAAYAEHRPLLVAQGSRLHKANIVSMLITSTWRWVAGAVHWSKESLMKANSLQNQILRTAFRLARRRDENWMDWNMRTLREVRCYIHAHNIPRWSTLILTMQHQLLGHWARRTERLQSGHEIEAITMRCLRWRNLAWWEHQQALSCGRRHPRSFYPSNMERQVALATGRDWPRLALDRAKWKESLTKFLEMWDVKWARGRQCAIAA